MVMRRSLTEQALFESRKDGGAADIQISNSAVILLGNGLSSNGRTGLEQEDENGTIRTRHPEEMNKAIRFDDSC